MWPFSRKHRDLSELGGFDAKWTIAEGEYGGSPLIVRYNDSAKEWCSHPEFPIKLGFAIPLRKPDEKGLPDPDENAEIDRIEDVIRQEVSANVTGLHVLALTTGNMKEFVFYVTADADIAALHQRVQSLVTTHEVQCMAVRDPRWSTYKQFT